MRSVVEARGYAFDAGTRAMGMAVTDVRVPPPDIDLGRGEWAEYVRYLDGFGMSPGLLAGADPYAFDLLIARIDGESVATALALDLDGDCGIYNVSTLSAPAGAGSAPR